MGNIANVTLKTRKSYIISVVATTTKCSNCFNSIEVGIEYCPYCYSNIYRQIAERLADEDSKIIK